jgi:hypothetical protein
MLSTRSARPAGTRREPRVRIPLTNGTWQRVAGEYETVMRRCVQVWVWFVAERVRFAGKKRRDLEIRQALASTDELRLDVFMRTRA